MFLLRLSMRWLHAEKLWEWALAGIILAVPMIWGVCWASRATDSGQDYKVWGRQIAVFLFLGVRGIAEHHALLALPVAAVTAARLISDSSRPSSRTGIPACPLL